MPGRLPCRTYALPGDSLFPPSYRLSTSHQKNYILDLTSKTDYHPLRNRGRPALNAQRQTDSPLRGSVQPGLCGGESAAKSLKSLSVTLMKLKKMIATDDFRVPLLFLFLFTFILGVDLGRLNGDLHTHGSLILEKPILFSDSILGTIADLCFWALPIMILLAALNEKNPILKTSYLLGSLSFVLMPSVISRLGFTSLYAVRIISLLVAVMLLMKHLTKATEFHRPTSTSKKTTQITSDSTRTARNTRGL